MIWRNVIKGIIRASLPTIILPLIVVGFVIKYFGFTLDSLLTVLFLGQLYIIWAQLEVALMQTYLTTLEYEPEFKIEIKEESSENIPRYDIHITNTGKHLVRNIFALIDIADPQREREFIPITSLAPNETIFLRSFNKEIFHNSVITIDIDYETALGKFGETSFMKDPKIPVFIAYKPIRMPGILLNSLENLLWISRSLTLSRRIKKMKKTRNTQP